MSAHDAEIDDTTGHVLFGEAAQDPASGGRAPSLRAAAVHDADDAEGHLAVRRAGREASVEGAPTDDAPGHDDDAEGHLSRM